MSNTIKNEVSKKAQNHTFFENVTLHSDATVISYFNHLYNFIKKNIQFIKKLENENLLESNEDNNESGTEYTFKEEQSEYSLLLALMRLSKFFEHTLIKKYIYDTDKNKNEEFCFETALALFKKNKIITNEEEEESVLVLQHFSNLLSHDFLYKQDTEDTFTLLSQDKQMTINIDHTFLLKMLENAKLILYRIYGIQNRK